MRLHTRTVAALLLSLSCDSVSSPATVSTPAPETQAAPKRQPPGPTDSPLIYGRVVGVSGGDDVTVLDAGRRRHEIRPLGVDAPEKGQDFGGRSKHCPSDIIFGRDVRAEYEKKGRYGRTLGKVMVGGRGANLEQVRAGLACFYGHHAGDVPEADRAALDGGMPRIPGVRPFGWIDYESHDCARN